MNPLVRSVLLAVGGGFLAAINAKAELTNSQAHSVSPPLVFGSSDLRPAPSNSAPVVYFGQPPQTTQPLKPGVYQTRPYAMILVVTVSEVHDHCVVGGGSSDSKMPVISPSLQAVPKMILNNR